ncbi:acyltransferase [Aureimonas leprariae]|uniref:Acyltransferase family protein n=1 Tax=Plantimonas leprariae TaxID=2615207 RepID=A0A7V7TXR1_9HYPH|nr:acyltransferase family protein [Aureimonas leprariae]KAB0675922.1 acyltransferase family protein [Aureimonas leprariae]
MSSANLPSTTTTEAGFTVQPPMRTPSAGARNANLDVLRVLACLAVVLLHVSGRTIYLYGEISYLSWNAANFISSSTRWCVPEFVMISGALLLTRPIPDPISFVRRRFGRIAVPIIVWSAVYLWWRTYWYGESFGASAVALELFLGFPYYHLYFLFMIAGLYVFTPTVAAVVRSLPRRQALAFAWLALATAGITMTVQGLNGNALTQFVPYLGYFALGALLLESRVPPSISGSLFVAGILVTAGLTHWTASLAGINGPWGMYFYSYFNPTVLIMAPALFCCVTALRLPRTLMAAAERLAPLTLGVFLIHPLVLETLRALYARFAPPLLWPVLDLPVTFVLTLLLATACVTVIRHIPLLRYSV